MVQATRRRIILNPATRSPAGSQRLAGRRQRSNKGEIVSLVMPKGNPAKGKSMAKTKQRSTGRAAGSTTRRNSPKHAHSAAAAPARRKNKRNPATAPAQRKKQRNPGRLTGGQSVGGILTAALFTIGGAVGSKLLTQAVLGDKNKGLIGYGVNGLSAFGLSVLANHLTKSSAYSMAILSGGVVQIVLRAITDYTPFGRYTANLGMGDYQASNFVTPQRYVDAQHSAEVEIPAGWAPTMIAAPAAAAAGSGMGGLYGGSCSGGLY